MTRDCLQHLLDIADRYTTGSTTWNATFTAPVVQELIGIVLANLADLNDDIGKSDLEKRIDEYLFLNLPKDPRQTALPEVVKKS